MFVPGISDAMIEANRGSIIGRGGMDNRYRSSTIPSAAPTARDTSISLHPATSSGTTAPTCTVPPSNVSEPPTSSLRSRALDLPSTALPSESAARTRSRYASGRKGAYASGSTANASIGIRYGGSGRSTVVPSASWDADIQRVSPATMTTAPSAGVVAACRANPGGSEPEIHASHACGIRRDDVVAPGEDADGAGARDGVASDAVATAAVTAGRGSRDSANAPDTMTTAMIAANVRRFR